MDGKHTKVNGSALQISFIKTAIMLPTLLIENARNTNQHARHIDIHVAINKKCSKGPKKTRKIKKKIKKDQKRSKSSKQFNEDGKKRESGATTHNVSQSDRRLDGKWRGCDALFFWNFVESQKRKSMWGGE